MICAISFLRKKGFEWVGDWTGRKDYQHFELPDDITEKLRAANDSSKIMPTWVFAILGLISGVVGVINSLVGGDGISAILGSVITLILSALIFIAANTIKKSR